MIQTKHTLSLLAILSLAVPALTQAKPAAVFSDHMVLQRGKPIAIWGSAAKGEAVTVTLDGKSVSTRANASGQWRVQLEEHAAGGPFELQIKAAKLVTIKDVLIGEVWVCSGQSNMEWPIERFEDCKAAAAQASDNHLRILHIPKHASEQPQSATSAKWMIAVPENLPSFSAVGYGFGIHLRKTLDVPIGLVQSAWGGTRAEAWTREAALARHTELTPILERWQATFDALPITNARYEEAVASWKTKAKTAKAAGKKAPRKPRTPVGRNDRHAPARLFHGMITPLLPMSIRGVIWYQGESNAKRAFQYRTLFPTMITDWRDAFGQGQFPFLFVQLAAFEDKRGHPHNWAELREAQTMTLSLPNTGMACIIDIGAKDNIHPPHKLEVGRRLALLALADTYGHKLVASGPLFSHFEVEGGQIQLHFRHVGAGLTMKGEHLQGFEIATAEGEFVPAQAVLRGNTVIVSSDKISAPRHVRYAWRHWPTCNLFNQEGLPASPFRTDTRKAVTADQR